MTEPTPASPSDEYATPPEPPVIAPTVDGPYVATAGGYYRNMRYIMVALIVGLGLYFAYDGLWGYPAENDAYTDAETERNQPDLTEAKRAELDEKLRGMKLHQPSDIMLQKLLGFSLPPLGLIYLAWTLYNSRGQIRLEDGTLHVPGHPPLTMDQITDVDGSKWDRKGIAFVHYEAGGKTGRARLDDFVYQREPIDTIYDAIVGALTPTQFDTDVPSPDAEPESDDLPTV